MMAVKPSDGGSAVGFSGLSDGGSVARFAVPGDGGAAAGFAVPGDGGAAAGFAVPGDGGAAIGQARPHDTPIGIIANAERDHGLRVTGMLVDAILAAGGVPMVATGAPSLSGQIMHGRSAWPSARAGAPKDLPRRIDRAFAESCDDLLACSAWVCIGGDGTMIRASKPAASAGVPLVGVNMGALGYLAEAEAAVESEGFADLARKLVRGEFKIEERMMLEVSRCSLSEIGKGFAETGKEFWLGRSTATALNEVTVIRGGTPRVISLGLYVNSTLLDVFSGDGVLVSTPTGSTAYAFSAGGPIVDPDLSAFLVVPICPHMAFPRPMLAAPGKTVTIAPHAMERRFMAEIAVDGVPAAPLRFGEGLAIRRAERPARIIRLAEDSFYVTLQRKLFSKGEQARREESRPSE